MAVIKIDDFKAGKVLDEEYFRNFVPYINKYFKDNIKAKTNIKKVYFLMNYLETTINILFVLLKIDRSDNHEKAYDVCSDLLIDWFEKMLKELKG